MRPSWLKLSRKQRQSKPICKNDSQIRQPVSPLRQVINMTSRTDGIKNNSLPAEKPSKNDLGDIYFSEAKGTDFSSMYQLNKL